MFSFRHLTLFRRVCRSCHQVQLVNPEPLLYHGEVVYLDGEAVGDIRAASYGHSLGGAVGLAMVEARPRALSTSSSASTASPARGGEAAISNGGGTAVPSGAVAAGGSA